MLIFGIILTLGGAAFLGDYYRNECAGGSVGLPEICGEGAFYLAWGIFIVFFGFGVGSIYRHFYKKRAAK